jgi:hypothetical protein
VCDAVVHAYAPRHSGQQPSWSRVGPGAHPGSGRPRPGDRGPDSGAGWNAGAVSRPGPPAGDTPGPPDRLCRLLDSLLPAPLGLLGRTRVRALLRQPARPLPSPRWLAAAALLVPPLGAAGSELAPELGNAGPAVVATAASVAVVNAAGEELLWRGLFVATFPDDPVRGWLWPAVGFTAWHLAPLAVVSSRREWRRPAAAHQEDRAADPEGGAGAQLS